MTLYYTCSPSKSPHTHNNGLEQQQQILFICYMTKANDVYAIMYRRSITKKQIYTKTIRSIARRLRKKWKWQPSINFTQNTNFIFILRLRYEENASV